MTKMTPVVFFERLPDQEFMNSSGGDGNHLCMLSVIPGSHLGS
jgi:hypothetical protein